MIARARHLYELFPRQYWLMIAGLVLATAGGSMIWPFMLIYVSGKLALPLGVVAPLISINAGTGLLSSFVAGTLADRIGRKVVMNVSLTLTGIGYLLMMRADTYLDFVWLMVLIGFSGPLYQVGADAMLADMIPSERRTEAYAINRIANNAAFAMGPALGGFLATSSYNLAFIGAVTGFFSYSLLLFLRGRETLIRPSQASGFAAADPTPARLPSGYGRVWRDRSYLTFVLLMSIGLVAPMMLWILMPVYAKTNFGILESVYGWIPTTNALMCVFVQYPVTQITRRLPAIGAVAAGMLFYAVGVGSVFLMRGFWGFWLSMVILTFGELTLVPTASKFVADLAPADIRGRYMSIYWLGWGIARTAAPLLGGFLNDAVAPGAIWIGGLTVGLISTTGLLLMSRYSHSHRLVTA